MRTKRQILEELIAKEQDQAKLKALQTELVEMIEADAIEKAKADMAAQAKAEQEKADLAKAAQASAESVFAAALAKGSGIQFLDAVPADYKGFNLKKTLAYFQTPELKRTFPGIHQRAVADPQATGKVIKLFADMIDDAMANPLKGIRKAAMQEGTDSEGGYVVPNEQRFEILSYVREQSIAMRDCTTIPMTSDVMTLPRELTQVSVAFTSEESEATETEPTLDQVTLTAKRMDAYSITSNELLQDAANPGGIVGLLMSQFVEAVGQKIDSATFLGTGDPVSGVFLSTGYSETFSTGSSHFSELLEVNLRNVIGKIPTSRLAGAKWYGHRTPVWTYVYGLKDGDQRPLFIPSMTEGVPHRLYGYPLEMPEQAKSTSAASTAMLVFGNLKGFWIGERLGRISLFVNPYTLSTKYQTIFLLFTRWAFAQALPKMYARVLTAS